MHTVERINFQNLARKNKYNAVRKVYNGITYHSQEEATYATELDFRLKAKEIVKWERQKKIPINVRFYPQSIPMLTDTDGLELKKEGIEFDHICNYYIDFVVHYPDKSIEYIEVKGVETEVWKLKWRICEAIFKNHPFITLKVVKAYNTWRNYKPKKK